MKKLLFISLFVSALSFSSCTEEIIKEVEVVKTNHPDSLQMMIDDPVLFAKYKLICDSIKSGHLGPVPDFFIVSYGIKKNSYYSGFYNTNYTGNHISFQFFDENTRYYFVTRKIKDLSPGNEYVSQEQKDKGILFNSDFYSGQYVYEIIQTYY